MPSKPTTQPTSQTSRALARLTLRRSTNIQQMEALLEVLETEAMTAPSQLVGQFARLKSMRPAPAEASFDGLVDSMSFIEVAQAALALGWEVQLPSGKLRAARDYSIEISSAGNESFILSARFDFEGYSATLPQIVEALQTGERLVALADGTRGLLPEVWSKKFAPIAEIGTLTPQGIRLTRLQTLFVTAVFEEGDKIKGDATYLAFREMITDFQKLRPEEPGEHFHGSLRPYQKEGLSWLKTLARHKVGGILADDMGLGKTVQILALLSHQIPTLTRGAKYQKCLPSLIVAPKSLLFNWASEAAKFAPDLEVLTFTGDTRDNDVCDADLVLTTYQTMRIHIDKLKLQHFEYFIMDEAHTIKNRSSQVFQTAKMIQANRKLAMTGTPVENSLLDLFSILSVVSPELISEVQGQRWAMKNDPLLLKALAKALKPFILRRTKQEVLTDLPAKTEQVLFCELSASERKRYSELKTHYWSTLKGKIKDKGLARSGIDILEGLLRLRQAACHQALLEKDPKRSTLTSTKFELVLEQLETILKEGSRALIFSQFTSLLGLFGAELSKRGISFEYLDGQTKDRAERVVRFQSSDEAKVFLLSLKAGGVGLNLTSADYVFILDPWWNPAAEAQAIDRAHRMGQKKKVFAYKIIAKDTVEEKILALQEAKKQIASAIVSNDASTLSRLSLSDLETLFT